MEVDIELERWRRQWQSAPADLHADLRQRVARSVRMAWIGLTLSVMVTVVFGVGLPIRAIGSGRLDVAVLAVGVWVMLIAAWATSIRLSRGTWRPAADTTAAFLEFSVLSCRRRRQSIAAAAVLYVVLLAFVMTWKYHALSRQAPLDPCSFLTSEFNIVVWLVTLALALLALWRRRVLQRELDNLLRLSRHYVTT
jgi:hypothetical protein